MAIAYLMLGSNLGDKSMNLHIAEEAVKKETGTILAKSAIYESEPWGFKHPENFYNQLLIIETKLEPETLLWKILEIEAGMGRVRNKKDYEARSIDIDIIFYDNLTIQKEKLVIPHPKIAERKFVLLPLLELAPDLIHPVYQQTIWEMYRNCTDQLEVRLLT